MQYKKLGNERKVDLERLMPMEEVSVDLGYLERVPYLTLVDTNSGYKSCWRIKDSSTKSVVTQLDILLTYRLSSGSEE